MIHSKYIYPLARLIRIDNTSPVISRLIQRAPRATRIKPAYFQLLGISLRFAIELLLNGPVILPTLCETRRP